MTSTPPSPVRRVLAARAAGTPRSSAPGAPGAARRAPFCGPPAPALVVAPTGQTFVGSNNVNFLEPTGQFGSRYEVYNVIFAFLV
jgi:hypothetical protein